VNMESGMRTEGVYGENVKARSQNGEKWLLASYVCLFCPPAWNNSAVAGRIFIEVDIWVFFENLSRTSSFIQLWQE
jgi:hypothetical protein